jgi:hypothetical protein
VSVSAEILCMSGRGTGKATRSLRQGWEMSEDAKGGQEARKLRGCHWEVEVMNHESGWIRQEMKPWAAMDGDKGKGSKTKWKAVKEGELEKGGAQ